MSDFLRGNHTNTNSPYFETIFLANASLEQLEQFAEDNLANYILDWFLDNASETQIEEFENLDLLDFPSDIRLKVVADYVQEFYELVNEKYRG